MATAGSLAFTLSADGSQVSRELGRIRQESQSTANALTNLFGGETISVVGLRIARSVITGTINDLDQLNAGLSLTESLTRNVAAGFADMGDIALLQLGQIATFLGEDLFETPLAGLQSSALQSVGLGQLEGAFQVITAGSNAVKILEVALGGASGALNLIDDAFGSVQSKAQSVSAFFQSIAQNAQLVSTVLVAVANGIDTAVEQLLDTVSELNPAFKQTREAAKALGIEFSVGRAVLGDWIDEINRIDNAATTAVNAADAVADGADSARRSIGNASEAVAGFGVNLQNQQRAAAGFESAIQDLADAGQLLSIYNSANQAIEQFTGSLQENFNAAKGAETLRNRLELVSVSAGGAAEDLSFLGELTNRLGVDAGAASQGYVQFSTAANLANLSVGQTREVFEGVTQASAAFGLSAAETQGVFLALQQSLSSGNVQLEELNQLAERIPGTFDAAAKALGVTTRELKGLISTGQVSSAEFLPKFAQQLKSFTDAGVVDAMNSGEAAVNRFNNALGRFSVAAGQAWLEVGTPALNTFAKALEFAAKNEELFSTAIDAILVASIPLFISALAKASTAVAIFIKTNQTATITLFGQQISATASQIGKFAGQVALAYAATILFYRNLDRAKDSAETTRSAITSLDKSLLELTGTGNDAVSTLSSISIEPPPLDWIDAGVKGFKDFQEQFGIIGQIATNTLAPIVGLGLEINKLVNFIRTGSLEVVTASEKALNDQLVAIGDFAERAQTILGKSLEFRATASGPGGVLNELKQIEIQLKGIEAARLKANPNDQQAIEQIAKQEADVLKRQAELREQVTAQQSALNNALVQARQELQNLDASKLGTAGFEQAKQALEVQIGLLEKEQAEFDKLTKVAANAAKSITDEFEKSTKDLDKAFGDTQAKIEEALASGKITAEEANQQRLDAERDFLQERLRLNQDAEKQLRTELERNAKLKAIDPTKATLSADQEKEFAKQLEQIELDSAKTRIDIAKNIQANKQQINEQELATVREQQAEAEAVIKQSETRRIAEIKKRQAAGTIGEEQAAKELEAVQRDSLTAQVEAEQDKLNEVKRLRAEGVLSAEQAAQQEREILSNLSDLNLQRIEQELQARREANSKIVEEFEAGIKQAEQAIERAQTGRRQQTVEQQLSGQLSPEQAAEAEARAEQQAVAQTIALRRQQQAQIQQLRERGVIGAKDAAEREADVLSEIGELTLKQVELELAAQERLKQAREEAQAKRLEQATKAAEAEGRNATLATTNQITAIKQRQALGVVSEQQAAAQIAQVQAKASETAVAIKQRELSQIRELLAQGQIATEAGQEREKSLIEEIANLRSQQADQQLAQIEQEQSARVALIEQELSNLQTVAEVREAQNQQQADAVARQTELLSAQSALLEAQSGLNEQRLQFALEEAEAEGNSKKAAELKKRILDEQIKAQQQQARIAQEQLRLQQQQNRLELENQQIQAAIALTEAQINIQKAVASGATQAELANLQQIEALRLRQLAALQQQAGQQAQINALEQQALNLQQQKTAEALKQQQLQQKTASATAGTLNPSGRSGGQSSLGSLGGGGSTPQNITQLTDRITDIARNGSLADVFNASNLNLSLKLGLGGAGQIGMQAPGLGTSAVTSKLDELIAATKQSAGRPNLSISNVNDLGMAGQIYSDLSRDSARGAGL